MVAYLGDLIEDAMEFLWQRAKVAHAILLCKSVDLSLGKMKSVLMGFGRLMPRHVPTGKQTCGKTDSDKPWFCKNFQTSSCSFSRDHESNGRLQRHICILTFYGETFGTLREKLSKQGTATKKRVASYPSLGWNGWRSGSNDNVVYNGVETDKNCSNQNVF